MKKLKVGDRVVVVATVYPKNVPIGTNCVISKVMNNFNYMVKVGKDDHEWYFFGSELELANSIKEEQDSFETQIKQVAAHLQEKPITSWEAINTYRITRLSAVIHELRKNNTITSVWENNGKVGKEKKRWTKYTLIK